MTDPRIARIAERFDSATSPVDAAEAKKAHGALVGLSASASALRTARQAWPSAGTTAIKTAAVNAAFPLVLDGMIAALDAVAAVVRATVRQAAE